MKLTLDVPDSLVKQVKLRALREGRKLKDEVADLLRGGLGAARRAPAKRKAVSSPRVKIDPTTGLPVIECRRAAARGEELSADRVAQTLAAQEAGWARDSG